MKDVVIKIVTTQNMGQNEEEPIELITDGKYSYENDSYEIDYMESSITGMEGTRTTVKITPMEVMVNREGTFTSSTVFKKGSRNTFLYDTPYGKMTMGVNTNKIDMNFNEHGGEIEVEYVLDMDHAIFGRNNLKMQVKEQESYPV